MAFSFTLSVLVVVALAMISKWRTEQPNAFFRKYRPLQLVGTGFIRLNSGNWTFAGGDSITAILNDRKVPNKLLFAKITDKDTISKTITGCDTVRLYRGFFVHINPSGVFLFDGQKPSIITGDKSNLRLNNIHRSPYFTAALPLSSGSFILREVKGDRQNYLVKLLNDQVVSNYRLSESKASYFSSDGELSADPTGRLFYTFFYRNQFLSLDSNLHILYKGKTIDTVGHPTIKDATITSKNEITLATPPVFVNKNSATNGKYLFINSGLKADNDADEAFNTNAVIDVYLAKNGHYFDSFYLPLFKNSKLREFRVFGNRLLVLYPDCLYFYKLNF
ncbi:hypothetical protein [Mucilaginibacter ximonensis]|uniref:hypothetical protein n=1 Tax=Mucilaginibacter ximonensis TaxID=538021 RepID=UPI00366FF83D